MNYLKRHKELIPLVAAVILLGFAADNLFDDQQQNSSLLNSGATLSPSSFSGRAACKIPTPDLYNRAYSAPDSSNMYSKR